MNKTPTTLIIMDGFGLSNDTVGNAVRAANTPVLDGLFAEYAHTTLQASGLDVGLPAGGLVLPWPYEGEPGAATIDGLPAHWKNGELRITRPGAQVRIAAP